MVVLISGATGFIGSALVRACEAAGHTVVGLTRRDVPPPSATCRLVSIDLADADATAKLSQLVKPDVVLHAAAVMSNRVAGAGSDYNSNEPITRNLLRAFESSPPRCLIYIGSIDVYAPSPVALTENARVEPATPYAASKLSAEITCREWARTFGVQLKVARFTQIFGPGDPTAKFIPAALAAVKAGRSISLFGDGEDRRDYLFVEDAARLVALWLPVDGGVDCLNFASGTSYSINGILDLIRPLSPNVVQVERLPRKKTRQDLKLDTTALRRELGSYELTPMTEALRITYDSLV